MSASEDQAIVQCQTGDLKSFGLLYDMYVQKIYAYFFYRTVHKESAEDLTQQTFFKAMQSIKSFERNKGSFSGWLYKIAVNCLIDHFRSRVPTVPLEEPDNFIERKLNSEMKEAVEARWRLDKVLEYLKGLDEAQREIVIMRIWEQLSYQEIAQITGKSEASLKMLFSRTIVKLRKDLAYLAALLGYIFIK